MTCLLVREHGHHSHIARDTNRQAVKRYKRPSCCHGCGRTFTPTGTNTGPGLGETNLYSITNLAALNAISPFVCLSRRRSVSRNSTSLMRCDILLMAYSQTLWPYASPAEIQAQCKHRYQHQ